MQMLTWLAEEANCPLGAKMSAYALAGNQLDALSYARKFVPDYEEDQMLNPDGEARSEAVNL